MSARHLPGEIGIVTNMLGCAVPLSNLLEGLKVSDDGMMADCCDVSIGKIDAGEL